MGDDLADRVAQRANALEQGNIQSSLVCTVHRATGRSNASMQHLMGSGSTTSPGPATHAFRGRPLVVPICGVFEIRDGRIAAWREYFDPPLFAR